MKKKSSANFIRILKSQTFIDLSDLKTGWDTGTPKMRTIWDTGTLKMQTKMLETKSCWDTGTLKMQTGWDTGTLIMQTKMLGHRDTKNADFLFEVFYSRLFFSVWNTQNKK